MSDAVAAAIAERRHLLVEAGTGVGKSFAYLLPAMEHIAATGGRVVVSTYTIALQEQLIQKDIPALNRVLSRPVPAILVMGRQNYLGLRRLMQTSRRQQTVLADSTERTQLHRIEDWAYTTKEGTRSDLDFQPLPQLWQRVRSESNNCMGPRCATYDKCFYQRARRKINDARLLVVNHALFFADLALRQRDASILPDYDCVIFDEAHNIEQVASDHFGLSLSRGQLAHLLNGIFNPATGRGFIAQLGFDDAIRAATEAHRIADALFDELAALPTSGRIARGGVTLAEPPNVSAPLAPALQRLAEELKKLRDRFDEPDEQFELSAFADRCREHAGAINLLLKQDREGHVYWLESSIDASAEDAPRLPFPSNRSASRAPRRRAAPQLSLHAAPVSVAAILREELFEKVKSVILTSATLSTGGAEGFTYLRKRIGLFGADADELALDSPFDYPRQVTLHLETRLPEPSAPEFLDDAADRILHYVRAGRGRAFVLFTSYDAMNKTANLIGEPLEAEGFTLLVQGRALPRGRMIAKFKKTEGAVLFGTDSFWQGVDVPGDALQTVIITKLPFAAPDKPLLAARCEAIRAEGGNPFNELQVPEAVLKLKQGFGRLIRTRTDTGVVVILDRRVRTKPYGRKFLDALPPCRVDVH